MKYILKALQGDINIQCKYIAVHNMNDPRWESHEKLYCTLNVHIVSY